MIDLPFKYKYRVDNEESDEMFKKLRKEKKLTGGDITNIIERKLKQANFLTKRERNYKSENINPFDLVAGDKSSLTMYGFEVKGDTDTYQRLTGQLDSYLFACRCVFLVVHKKKIPEWLPREIGVIRVFKDETVFIERPSFVKDQFDISSVYEWEALFRANGLGKASHKTKQLFSVLESARKNILFNRFFAISAGYNTYKFEKFYAFSEEEKSVLIGFDVPYHFTNLERDIKGVEKRLANLKRIIGVGTRGLHKFMDKEKLDKVKK